MGFLADYSEKELKEWYKSQVKQRVEKNGNAIVNVQNHSKQSRLNHDFWNAYDYGDLVRFVYIKSAPKTRDTEKEDFFEDRPIHKKPTFEKIEKTEDERFSSSIKRSKARIFELAMCNEFKYFCTFTQDENKRDRFDLKDFRKDFAMLVRNLNRSRPVEDKIKYLLIPEQHKNGAWHMHGLLQGLTADDLREFTLKEKLPTKIRKAIKNGEKIYDWTRYRKAFGYFTCTEIENHTAVSKYITKYISKDLQKTVRESNEHLFFASQGLKSRDVIMKNCYDKCPVDSWDFENEYVKIKDIKIPR